jgi:DNA-binding transcriptional ArsR family regulator
MWSGRGLYLTRWLFTLGSVPADQLSRTFAALADPTRRSILARLAEGEATVNELAQPFAVSLPAISRHLKVLERAGLIARSREAQWRPSRMQADPLDDAVEWMQSRKRTWEARIDRLDAHLRTKEKTR